MRVLMLGWEFPPYISGGLGTACYGLTKGLNKRDVDVLFVLPKHVDADYTQHLKVISPPEDGAGSNDSSVSDDDSGVLYDNLGLVQGGAEPERPADLGIAGYEKVSFRMVPTSMSNPYGASSGEWQKTVEQIDGQVVKADSGERTETDSAHADSGVVESGGQTAGNKKGGPRPKDNDYDGDMMAEVERYARMVVKLTRHEDFDVIHAHDWMTYPAGLALAGLSGKPLVVHVHSTEYDRSGENINSRIYDIERRGMHGAMRVVCVSMLTRSQVVHRYGIKSDKCEVVYNGIDMNGHTSDTTGQIKKGDKIVLFLGRITMQKGPEYFVAAAKKVLEKMEDVKFVMAGSGDKAKEVIELAAQMGIGHKILFTGFLRGENVEKIFNMAHVYVMPSVSEPFGIAPLEAIRHDVPVIISRNSGVSEVLQHALKVDFWDVDDMANKIIAILRHPPLSLTLREHAEFEVRKLTWEGAADKCEQIYHKAISGMTQNI